MAATHTHRTLTQVRRADRRHFFFFAQVRAGVSLPYFMVKFAVCAWVSWWAKCRALLMLPMPIHMPWMYLYLSACISVFAFAFVFVSVSISASVSVSVSVHMSLPHSCLHFKNETLIETTSKNIHEKKNSFCQRNSSTKNGQKRTSKLRSIKNKQAK